MKFDFGLRISAMSSASESEIQNPKSEISIVFMGTATFAVPPLQRLLEKGYKVAGVVTTLIWDGSDYLQARA